VPRSAQLDKSAILQRQNVRIPSSVPLPKQFGQCPLYPGARGELAINNDDCSPNVRPIAFSDSPRNQLSHNTIFSATLIPIWNH
jgi:hypothetical protein